MDEEVKVTRREVTAGAEEAAAAALTDLDKDEVELLEVVDEVFRGRRQSSDPDQLCPTVASYIMPRAAVNSKGIWKKLKLLTFAKDSITVYWEILWFS